MALVENKTKLKLQNNEMALGFGVAHLRTSATALIAAAADHDWLFIDMEHGTFSVQEATQLCISAQERSPVHSAILPWAHARGAVRRPLSAIARPAMRRRRPRSTRPFWWWR